MRFLQIVPLMVGLSLFASPILADEPDTKAFGEFLLQAAFEAASRELKKVCDELKLREDQDKRLVIDAIAEHLPKSPKCVSIIILRRGKTPSAKTTPLETRYGDELRVRLVLNESAGETPLAIVSTIMDRDGELEIHDTFFESKDGRWKKMK